MGPSGTLPNAITTTTITTFYYYYYYYYLLLLPPPVAGPWVVIGPCRSIPQVLTRRPEEDPVEACGVKSWW